MKKPTVHHTLTKLIAAAAALLLAAAPLDGAKPKGKQRTVGNVRSEQAATKKQIKETSNKIKQNTAETRRQLARLNALSTKIAVKNAEINSIQSGIDSLNRNIAAVTAEIDSLNRRIASLRESYTTAMRSIQGENRAMSPVAFVFASQSFTEAMRRIRYLQQFSEWQAARNAELRQGVETLTHRSATLDSLRNRNRKAAAAMTAARSELESSKTQTSKIVDKLKHENSSLKALLKEKEAQARRLDRELERLIEQQRRAEEERQRREQKQAQTQPQKPSKKTGGGQPSTSTAAADRALTGSFESNKGSLLFPVSGRYRIVRGFGRQKHPELQHVETENSGIDIEALSSPKARAIFSGKVSAIFQQPGYGNIVMIRHGNYLTIYANLGSIAVKNGDMVKTGQIIGDILADPEEENRTILHFELRKERTKLNPALWVK